MQNGQSRESTNIDEEKETKHNHNANMCWTTLYANKQNKVNKS